MKYPISLLTLIFFSCSTPGNKSNEQIKENAAEVKSIAPTSTATNTKWKTYTDTVSIDFVVSYKYPPNLVSEHFENAECIGRPVLEPGEGPGNTMDCSLWMDLISDGNVRPIDTLIQYSIDNFKEGVQLSKDTVTIANVKGLSVSLTDKNDSKKILRQLVFFTKYNTFFELVNDSLSQKDFQTFVSSLSIEKTN